MSHKICNFAIAYKGCAFGGAFKTDKSTLYKAIHKLP